MKLIVSGEQTRVSHRGRGTRAYKTPTSTYFDLVAKHAHIQTLPLWKESLLPPVLRWANGRCCLLEFEPQYRNITWVAASRRNAHKAKHHSFRLFIPRALILTYVDVWGSRRTIHNLKHMFLPEEDLTLNTYYHAPILPNSYSDGGICTGGTQIVESFSAMVGASLDMVYFNTFNKDLNWTYVGEPATLTEQTTGSTWLALFKTWSKATPEEVLSWKWPKIARIRDLIGSLEKYQETRLYDRPLHPLVAYFNSAARNLAPLLPLPKDIPRG